MLVFADNKFPLIQSVLHIYVIAVLNIRRGELRNYEEKIDKRFMLFMLRKNKNTNNFHIACPQKSDTSRNFSNFILHADCILNISVFRKNNTS